MEKKEPFLFKFLIIGCVISVLCVIFGITLYCIFFNTILKDFFMYVFFAGCYVFIGCMFFTIIGSVIFPSLSSFYKVDKKSLPKEFESLYYEEFKQHIANLEGERIKVVIRKILEKMMIFIIIGSYIIVGMDSYYIPKIVNEICMGIVIFGLLFLGLYMLIIYYKENKMDNFTKKYKDSVIRSLITYINPRINYQITNNERASVIFEKYIQAGFDKRVGILEKSTDYMEGFLNNGNYIKLCNMCIMKTTYSKYNKKFFEGVFGYINLEKKLNINIKILTKYFLGNLSNSDEGYEERFNRYFYVDSDENWYVAQIVNEQFRKRMVELREKYYVDFEIVIKENEVFLRFFANDILKPTLFSSNQKENVYLQLLMLRCIFDISNEVMEFININI